MRLLCVGGVSSIIAQWCMTTNRSYVLSVFAGPGIPNEPVVVPLASAFSSVTPGTYF